MTADEKLFAGLQAELAALEQDYPELAHAVKSVVLTNYASGRIALVRKQDAAFSAAAYVARVVANYQAWHTQVRLLQQARDDVWQPLYEKLQKWAYRLLQRRHFVPASPSTLYDHAVACASQAALVILEKPFPYDVHFERWAYRVLYFVCLRHIEAEVQATQDPSGQSIVQLENWENWLANLRDPAAERVYEARETRRMLLEAIDRLASDARKRFILLHYFEERSLAEVAQEMGLEMNALYKLHFDARRDLRRIWEQLM